VVSKRETMVRHDSNEPLTIDMTFPTHPDISLLLSFVTIRLTPPSLFPPLEDPFFGFPAALPWDSGFGIWGGGGGFN